MVRLQTLMDNLSSEHKGLVNEHGLSVFVEKDNHRFLFDCSASAAYLQNAYRLGVSMLDIEAVIISHSHYDHATGYRYLQELDGAPKVLYTGNHFFEKKYRQCDKKYTDLSAGFDELYLHKHDIRHIVVNDMLEITKGLWIIGSFTHHNSFETIPDTFVKQTTNGMQRDFFEDEICLAIETDKGLVVQVGCSHPGILNIVETVCERLNKPVYAVFGGTHLVHADTERIAETVKRLKQAGLKLIGFSHCSGANAEEFLRLETEVESCHLAVGDTIIF